MPSVYDPENFQGRVNLAAQYILRGSQTTRHFDACFEMADGDAVVAALYRRALKNPNLMEKMPKYLSMDSVKGIADSLANIPTRRLKDAARDMRLAFDKRYA